MSTLVLDKKADLAGPGIGDYTELEKILPQGYHSLLTPKDAGLPQPVCVQEVLGRTDDYKVSAKHGHDKLPRVRLLVEFAEEVPGPIAIGTGRYAGLGVFASA